MSLENPPEIFASLGFLYNPKTQSVLLHKRDAKAKTNPNKWSFFGGRNELGETPSDTWIREMKEELNIDIPAHDVKHLCDYFNQELDTYRYVFYIESCLDKTQMTLGEGEDFDWVPLVRVFDYDISEKTSRDLKLFLNTVGVIEGYYRKD